MGNLTTDNLNLPKPVSSNTLSVDVTRIRDAFDGFDTAVAAKAAASTVTAHIADTTNNVHGVTAAQVGAIPNANNAVTDNHVGNRTADPSLVPGTLTGNLTQWFSWLANRIKTITGKTNWYDPPATTLENAASHIGTNGNVHNATAAQVGAIADAANAVTDTHIGNRTADPTQTPSALVGTPTQWVSWLTNRVKAITGKTNWYDAPDTTLASAAAHIALTANNPHGTTAAQVGAPSTTGTGASGTWGISITGSSPWANITGKPTTFAGYGIANNDTIHGGGTCAVRLQADTPATTLDLWIDSSEAWFYSASAVDVVLGSNNVECARFNDKHFNVKRALTETKSAPTISSGTLTLNAAGGNVFAVSLNANISTLSFSNIPASGEAYGLTLIFTADGTARTVTWPAAVKWPGGSAPTMTSTNGKRDIFVLFTHDAGTTWFAFKSGQNL